jgi:hypothetical protein
MVHCFVSDLSFTHGQVPDSSFEDHPPNGVKAIHAAPTQWSHHNAVPWGDTSPQMELTVIEKYNTPSLPQSIHGVSSSSDLLEASPTMIADGFSSPLVGSYTRSEVQDDYTDAMSSPGEARSTTSAETQWQDPTAQEASLQGQQSTTKKSRDKERKRVQRSEDVQHFTKICSLLKIPPGPKKTLAYRSECFSYPSLAEVLII